MKDSYDIEIQLDEIQHLLNLVVLGVDNDVPVDDLLEHINTLYKALITDFHSFTKTNFSRLSNIE